MSPKVRKSSGTIEEFSEQKLLRSLQYSGIPNKKAQNILSEIRPFLHEEISSQKIYRLVFNRIKKYSKMNSVNYSLKRSIFDLGPSGYLFEKFVAELLKAKGHEVQVGQVKKGACVSHEIDVIGMRKDRTVYIECKFHNQQSRKNDIKTALYIYARSLDLKNNPQNDFQEFWLVSNTSFTEDAIQYAKCVGIKIVGINCPEEETIQDIVNRYKLHPITTLTSLTKGQKQQLLSKEVILSRELIDNPEVFNHIDIDFLQKKAAQSEAKKLMGRL